VITKDKGFISTKVDLFFTYFSPMGRSHFHNDAYIPTRGSDFKILTLEVS